MSSTTSPASSPPSSPKEKEYKGFKPYVEVPIELMLKQAECEADKYKALWNKEVEKNKELQEEHEELHDQLEDALVAQQEAEKALEDKEDRIDDLEEACNDFRHDSECADKEKKDAQEELEYYKYKYDELKKQIKGMVNTIGLDWCGS